MKNKIVNYIIGILIILCGLLIVFNPTTALGNIIKYTGILLMILGVIKIIYSAFNKDGFTIGNGGIFGIILFMIGLVLIVTNFLTLDFLTLMVSIYLIISSVPAIVYSFKTKQFTNVYFINNAIRLIFGLVLLLVPMSGEIITGIALGITLILYGISFFIDINEKPKLYSVKVKK